MVTFIRRKSNQGYLSFDDSLLRMSYYERFITRVVMNSWNVVYAVGTVILLFTDVRWAFWLGILNLLYLFDRIFHYGKPQVGFPVDAGWSGNVALFLSPRCRRLIGDAYNNVALRGGGFLLNLVAVLVETKPVIEMLARLGVEHREFKAKADAYLVKSRDLDRSVTKMSLETERLIIDAFRNSQPGQKKIDCGDLFAAVLSEENEEVRLLFDIFEINRASLMGVSVFGREAGIFGIISNIFGLVSIKAKKILNSTLFDSYSLENIILLVSYRAMELERKNKVFILYEAIETSVSLANRYLPEKPVLRESENILTGAVRYVLDRGNDIVRSEDVVSALSGI